MSNRDARRAAKRRTKRKAEAKVERTGPGGELLLSAAGGISRMHELGCRDITGGVCAPDCETDEQLRARLVEREG